MALFNELQVGRFNSILHKLLNMKDNAPAPQLASDLSPGITLESERPEWGYLGGENLLCATVTSGPGVAQVSQGQLFNPVGSNVLAVLLKIYTNTGAAAGISINRTAVLAAASGAGSARDFRLGTGGVSVCRVTGVTPAGASVQILGQLVNNSTSSSIWDDPIIVAPGTGINVNSLLINTTLQVTFIWRERVWELSERR